MKTICISISVSIIILSNIGLINAQSKPDVEKLAPKQAINFQITVTPMMTATVHISIGADIQESQACKAESLAYGGLKMEFNWYNKSDETGKMMLGFVSNKPDIEKHWISHKQQIDEIYKHYSAPGNSLMCNTVKEEDVPSGKLYMVDYSYAYCDTDKALQHSVNAKCFFFNGTCTGNIEINCQCSIDEVRNMIKSIISEADGFNFLGLM